MVQFKIKIYKQVGGELVRETSFEAVTHQEARDEKYRNVIKKLTGLPDGDYCSEIYELDEKCAHFPSPPFRSKDGRITFY